MNGEIILSYQRATVWCERTFVFILKVKMGNDLKGIKVSKTIAYRRIRKGLHSALNRRLANLIGFNKHADAMNYLGMERELNGGF